MIRTEPLSSTWRKRWVDGLFALGVDDDAEEFPEEFQDAQVTERDLPAAIN